jgi:DNA-binding response OmpR family regulator
MKMKNKIKILLVEDDQNLGSITSEYLNAKGFDCKWEKDGEAGYQKILKEKFDLFIFDVMMPIKDGFTLAKDVRGIDKKTPILFLTAKSMKEDTLKGFEIGADDYVTKPFNIEELIARIKAIVNRTKESDNHFDDITIGSLSFNPKMQMLKSKNKSIKLTTKESELLILLCKNKNDILERNFALKAVWGDDNYFNGRSMDVYIAKLRKYLKEETNIQIINVHGKGFKLLEEKA